MSKKNKPSPPGVLDVLGVVGYGFSDPAGQTLTETAPDPLPAGPRLGQIVRLRWGGQCFTAIVAYAYPDGVVNLTVFNHDGSTRSERHVPRAVGSGFGWLPPEA